MTNQIDKSTSMDPRDCAAFWYERILSDDLSAEESQAFELWFSDSDNRLHYERIQKVWEIASTLSAAELNTIDHERSAVKIIVKKQYIRSKFGYGLGLVCSMVVALFMINPMGWFTNLTYEQKFKTAHGEQRQIVLPDGSHLMLNTDTIATVRFSKRNRSVTLSQGEALFSVQSVDDLPFTVQLVKGSVQVTGTEFAVLKEGQGFTVTVLEGSVNVYSGAWWNQQSIRLRSGNASKVQPDGQIVSLLVDMSKAVAWRDGKVVFRGTPLAETIKELNRYSHLNLRISDSDAGQLRVSGIFNVKDPLVFLHALPQIVPVTVQFDSDGGGAQIFSR